MAHKIDAKPRTQDIYVNEDVTFTGMYLSEKTSQGLKKCGFITPSPIQVKAIPIGRCGYDLVMQAKSGTGKTCVFTIVALEMLRAKVNAVQVLILAPTREIAVQIKDVIEAIGSAISDLRVHYFIGGLPVEEDVKKLKQCQVAIGAPGRVKHLMKSGILQPHSIRLFVLDEADRLMDSSFLKDIKYIYNHLPERKQIIASSATYPDGMDEFVSRFMQSPVHITAGTDGPILLGVKQFVLPVKKHLSDTVQLKLKEKALHHILSHVPFHQCLIFSNYQTRAESVCNRLKSLGWAAAYVSSCLEQEERIQVVKDLRKFHFRVLVSTDLISRGIDAENVNMVINLDIPSSNAVYLHRIGRCGRYGSHGIAISIVAEGPETRIFQKMLGTMCVRMLSLDDVSETLWSSDVSGFKKLQGIIVASHESKSAEVEDSKTCQNKNKAGKTSGKVKRDSCLENGHSYDGDIDDLVGFMSETSLNNSCKINVKERAVKHFAAALTTEHKNKVESFEQLVSALEDFAVKDETDEDAEEENAAVAEEEDAPVAEEEDTQYGEVLLEIANEGLKSALKKSVEESKQYDTRSLLQRLAEGQTWPTLETTLDVSLLVHPPESSSDEDTYSSSSSSISLPEAASSYANSHTDGEHYIEQISNEWYNYYYNSVQDGKYPNYYSSNDEHTSNVEHDNYQYPNIQHTSNVEHHNYQYPNVEHHNYQYPNVEHQNYQCTNVQHTPEQLASKLYTDYYHKQWLTQLRQYCQYVQYATYLEYMLSPR